MTRFMLDVKEYYGLAMLQEIQKISYTVNFLDRDSIQGVKTLARILVPASTYALETSGLNKLGDGTQKVMNPA